MTPNSRNIKSLTDYELVAIKTKYSIKVVEKNIVVAVNTRNQTTIHKMNKNFNLRINDRKFTISERAIRLWTTEMSQYNLIDIQHVINGLIIDKKEVTNDNVRKELENMSKPKNDFI